MLSKLASIVTKCRQTVESRLHNLVKRDSTSILFNIAEIQTVAHLIANPEILNYILFCGYDKLLEYSAAENELIVSKFTV
jgi:hypothetical protein